LWVELGNPQFKVWNLSIHSFSTEVLQVRV
jgi:hypothetical protein